LAWNISGGRQAHVKQIGVLDALELQCRSHLAVVTATHNELSSLSTLLLAANKPTGLAGKTVLVGTSLHPKNSPQRALHYMIHAPEATAL
jgi:hypothetical protein